MKHQAQQTQRRDVAHSTPLQPSVSESLWGEAALIPMLAMGHPPLSGRPLAWSIGKAQSFIARHCKALFVLIQGRDYMECACAGLTSSVWRQTRAGKIALNC